MKKVLLVFLSAFMLAGCGFIPTPAPPAPTVEVPNTPTVAVPTETVQPTETVVPVTETFTATAEPVDPTVTQEPQANLTTTPATATNESVVLTTTTTAISFAATATPTLGVLTYGTLPPAVPYNTVVLTNKSKAQAYISMQQQDGKEAILEYPVQGRLYVDAPIGQYIYVAWVGGNKMTGKFRVDSSSTLYITIFKDRIVIEHL